MSSVTLLSSPLYCSCMMFSNLFFSSSSRSERYVSARLFREPMWSANCSCTIYIGSCGFLT